MAEPEVTAPRVPLLPFTGDVHVGRSWSTHELEDACPCPQEPCGLVDAGKVDPKCPEHSFAAAKTLRQSHLSTDCPGATS